MNETPLAQTLLALQTRLTKLEGEADIRRLQARYMFLCDTPCPEPVADDAERIEKILALYADDAVWEGVGSYYNGQFGRVEGKAAIRKHFQNFWGQKKDPALLLNVHYLTSEQIHVDGDSASGQWVHCQPWIFSDGKTLLRSSRLNNLFSKVDGFWKITRTRTENVFVAPLKTGWVEAMPDVSVLMNE